VQHELVSRVSVNAAWFRRDFRNLVARTNLEQSFSDYTPVNVVSPLDGSIVRMYNISQAAFTRIRNVASTDPDRKMWYNGYELSFNARLPRGVTVFGGTTTERMLWDVCSEKSNPNNLLYCDARQSGIPWRTQLKLAASYPLPWGILVSGALQSLPGYILGTTIPGNAGALTSQHPAGPGHWDYDAGDLVIWVPATNVGPTFRSGAARIKGVRHRKRGRTPFSSSPLLPECVSKITVRRLHTAVICQRVAGDGGLAVRQSPLEAHRTDGVTDRSVRSGRLHNAAAPCADDRDGLSFHGFPAAGSRWQATYHGTNTKSRIC
jgi:hypothetical protein